MPSVFVSLLGTVAAYVSVVNGYAPRSIALGFATSIFGAAALGWAAAAPFNSASVVGATQCASSSVDGCCAGGCDGSGNPALSSQSLAVGRPYRAAVGASASTRMATWPSGCGGVGPQEPMSALFGLHVTRRPRLPLVALRTPLCMVTGYGCRASPHRATCWLRVPACEGSWNTVGRQ